MRWLRLVPVVMALSLFVLGARSQMLVTNVGQGGMGGGAVCSAPFQVAPIGPGNTASAAAGGTSNIDVPAGHTVVVPLNMGNTTNQTLSLVDSVGNSYVMAQPSPTSTNAQAAIGYNTNVLHMPVGTTFTATTSLSGSYNFKGAWDTCTTGSHDLTVVLNQATANTGVTLSGTLGDPNETVFGYTYPQGTTITGATGFTSVYTNGNNDIAYRVYTGGGTASYNPAFSSSVTSSNVLVSFLRSGVLAYTPQGVNFNASAYATRGAALTGVADGKSGLMSVWINNPNAAGAAHLLLYVGTSGGTQAFIVYLNSSSARLTVIGNSSAPAGVLSMASGTNTFASMGTTWAHLLLSWNLATGRCQVYVNNVSDTQASPTCTNTAIAYNTNGSAPAVAALLPAASQLNGNIADLQFWANVDVDISNATNRGYFISGGNAVNPSVPASNIGQQCILMSGTIGTNGATWLGNAGGTCGTFTVQAGTISAAGTNPP